MNNQSLGRYGEDLAAVFLEGKGYRILDKNFKIKLGEMDIIAQDGKVICFIEVKSRTSLSCGMPYESVHIHKQRQMVRVAWSYLKFKFNTVDMPARFDVVSIYKAPCGPARIEHIVNAFDLTYLSH